MLIKNITDRNTPKVIGVGSYWLAPGEEKYIPDDNLYVAEVDRYGKETGKKVVLPALQAQVKLGMLALTEEKKTAGKKDKANEKTEDNGKNDSSDAENASKEQGIENTEETAKPRRTRKAAAGE